MAAGLKIYNLDPVTLGSGVASALSAATLPVYNIIVIAEASNTGNVYIGGANVSTSNGIPIEPGNTLTLEVSHERYSEMDAADVYAITSSAGNVVRIACFRRRL